MRRLYSIYALIIIFILFLGALDLKVYSDNTKALESVEVKEYKGERLGSTD